MKYLHRGKPEKHRVAQRRKSTRQDATSNKQQNKIKLTMTKIFISSLLLLSGLTLFSCKDSKKPVANPVIEKKQEWAIVIHGGAGGMTREKMDSATDADYRTSLSAALNIGKKILSEGGTAMDAVEQTIRNMEDNPLFNAGKGAVFNHEGKNELDAAHGWVNSGGRFGRLRYRY